eukprot:COSAG02_NODE_643_length_19037_cov_9.951632_6_plen_215_part_00
MPPMLAGSPQRERAGGIPYYRSSAETRHQQHLSRTLQSGPMIGNVAPQVAPTPSRPQPICHPRDPPTAVGSCARGCPTNRVGIHRRLWRICPPNRVGIHRRLWRGSSRIPCPSACPTRARVRSGIQTCTVRSQMSQSDVPIQNSQYVALFDDFCILVAPESDFPLEVFRVVALQRRNTFSLLSIYVHSQRTQPTGPPSLDSLRDSTVQSSAGIY